MTKKTNLLVQVFVDLLVDNNDVRIVQGKRDKSALNQQTRTLNVLRGEGKLISYFLLPLRNGYLPITATARSTSAADSLKRNLIVEVSNNFQISAKCTICGYPLRIA